MNKLKLLAMLAAVFFAIALSGCTTPSQSPDQKPGAIVGRPGQI